MRLVGTLILVSISLFIHTSNAHEEPVKYSDELAYAPSSLPDRITLSWTGDPSDSQTVTWRTDTSVKKPIAQIALANSDGWKMKPISVAAQSEYFKSDISEVFYHSVTFSNLMPSTLYAYRVGDGVNWSEYFHFTTAAKHHAPFSFIYFGDAQNDVKSHWSRVFREAYKHAPDASFVIHAGDLINKNIRDADWGEWHHAAGWVNGSLPIIATPGNHEYSRIYTKPSSARIWQSQKGDPIKLSVSREKFYLKSRKHYRLSAKSNTTDVYVLEHDANRIITKASDNIESLLGFTPSELIGTNITNGPLRDRRQDQGRRVLSNHWRPQFSFPVYKSLPENLSETVYYLDYQGVRIISLDSNINIEEQVAWLEDVLSTNPHKWTILTCHHPFFSPARERDNPILREVWKPILDKYRVDLVLTGHDHTYTRTGLIEPISLTKNLPVGYQNAYDPEIGTVYVVSVSGPKMYDITRKEFAKSSAENTQLFQVIEVENDELTYTAYTATGELHDSFKLIKDGKKPNILIEL